MLVWNTYAQQQAFLDSFQRKADWLQQQGYAGIADDVEALRTKIATQGKHGTVKMPRRMVSVLHTMSMYFANTAEIHEVFAAVQAYQKERI